MRLFLIKSLSLFACLFLAFTTANAATLEVKVFDKNGSPIEDAVVSWVMAPEDWTDELKARVAERKKEVAVMDQIQRQFVPFVLAVDRGREIIFPNSDRIHHHVYSFSKAKRFEIDLYANEPVSPLLFDKPGRVVLGCNIHDSMIAYIVVSDSPIFMLTNGAGVASFDEAIAPKEISVWHPWMGAEVPAKVIPYSQSKDGVLKVVVDISPPIRAGKRFSRRYRGEYEEEYDF